jgi:hypothetical protein
MQLWLPIKKSLKFSRRRILVFACLLMTLPSSNVKIFCSCLPSLLCHIHLNILWGDGSLIAESLFCSVNSCSGNILCMKLSRLNSYCTVCVYFLQQAAVQLKVKVKFSLEQAANSQRGRSYRTTLPLTSAVDGVGGQHHSPAALPPRKTRYPLYRWAPGPFWTGAENLAPTGIRSPD